MYDPFTGERVMVGVNRSGREINNTFSAAYGVSV
jgi:hypothetical protein